MEYLNKMEIYIIQKKLGSRKELGRRPVAQTSKENRALSVSEIAAQAEEGRIRFAENYGENHDTLEKAMQRTKQAYDDGLFRVFINGEEMTIWDAPIKLCQGTEIVFLRLTMLTGLYF